MSYIYLVRFRVLSGDFSAGGPFRHEIQNKVITAESVEDLGKKLKHLHEKSELNSEHELERIEKLGSKGKYEEDVVIEDNQE